MTDVRCIWRSTADKVYFTRLAHLALAHLVPQVCAVLLTNQGEKEARESGHSSDGHPP